MRAQQRRLDQQTRTCARIVVDDVFGPRAVPPEAGGDQHDEADPEQPAALPLQVGLAKNAFERTVRQGMRKLEG